MSNYNTEKKKHKVKSHSVGMILPLYIFTILFVACPLIYMVALSFATPGAVHGVEWIFTLDNYKKILEPVYLNTFVQSFKLAVTSTLIIGLVGYPFGYFMAKLPDRKEEKGHADPDASFLGEFFDPSVRMDYYPSEKRNSEFCTEKAGDH